MSLYVIGINMISANIDLETLRGRFFRTHSEYLRDKTILSTKEAPVLSLARLGFSPGDVKNILDITGDTLSDRWQGIYRAFNEEELLSRTIVEESPSIESWQSGERPVWLWPWERSVTVQYTMKDIDKVRDLFVDNFSNPPSYLLMERNVPKVESWKKSVEKCRTIHESSGLRTYLYTDSSSLLEWALSVKMLEGAGIDPGTGGFSMYEEEFDVSESEAYEVLEDSQRLIEIEKVYSV